MAEPGYVVPTVFHPEHRDFLAVVPPDPLVPGRRCWVSRSRLSKSHGVIRHEEHLERRLRAAGWAIFHPENHPIADQLAVLSSSETIAGFTGSASHSLMLLTRLESQITLFARRHPYSGNYRTIAQAKGFNQEIFAVPARRYSSGGIAAEDHVILQNFNSVLDTLKVPLAPTPTRDAADPRARLINLIAQDVSARSYLQIGLDDGATFLAVDVDHKTIVEPSLAIDGRAVVADQDAALYEMRADEFYRRFADEALFDVIAIVSPDTLEDALRAFCGSLPFTHDGTIWVIAHGVASDDSGALDNGGDEPTLAAYGKESSTPAAGSAALAFVLATHELFRRSTMSRPPRPAHSLRSWKSMRGDGLPVGLSDEAVSRLTADDLETNRRCRGAQRAKLSPRTAAALVVRSTGYEGETTRARRERASRPATRVGVSAPPPLSRTSRALRGELRASGVRGAATDCQSVGPRRLARRPGSRPARVGRSRCWPRRGRRAARPRARRARRGGGGQGEPVQPQRAGLACRC